MKVKSDIVLPVCQSGSRREDEVHRKRLAWPRCHNAPDGLTSMLLLTHRSRRDAASRLALELLQIN